MAIDGDDSQRKLGFWMCTALVVGNTIGIGIFLLPASLAPFGFNATIGWLVYRESLSTADIVGAVGIAAALVLVRLPDRGLRAAAEPPS